MVIQIQPPPVGDNDPNSIAWKDWYAKFAADVSNIDHNELGNIQGGSATGAGEYFHLTNLQWDQSKSWRSTTATSIPVQINLNTTCSELTVSEDLLTVTQTQQTGLSFPGCSAVCNTAITTGKKYWEVCMQKKRSADPSDYDYTIGFCDNLFDYNNYAVGKDNSGTNSVNFARQVNGLEAFQNDFMYRNTKEADLDLALSMGDPDSCAESFRKVGMIAIDMGTGNVWTGVNGVWDNSGNPGAGTNPVNTTLVTVPVFPAYGSYADDDNDNKSAKFLFPATSWQYSAPSGFSEIAPEPGVSEDTFLVPLSGGDQVILPAGNDWIGRHLAVKKVDDTVETCTITPGVGDNLEDGADTWILESPYQGIVIQKRANTWHILSQTSGSVLSDITTSTSSKRYSLLVS